MAGLDERADIAALLALGAAFFIAIGDVIHQRQAHDVTDEQISHVELFGRLLRDRQWWLGSLVAGLVRARIGRRGDDRRDGGAGPRRGGQGRRVCGAALAW